MRIRYLTLLLALAVGGAAHAADWTEVVSGKDRRVEIDRASILQSDPGTKVAWGRIVMKDEEVAAAGYKSVKALNRYDCRSSSFSTIKRVYLDSDENVLREERVVEPKVIKVAPGSVDERLFREVCKPPSVEQLASVAAQAEQAAEAEVPSIVPEIVKPLTVAQKEEAASAVNAALSHAAEAKRASSAVADAPPPASPPPARPPVVAPAAVAPAAVAPPPRRPLQVARASTRSEPRPSVSEPLRKIEWSYSGEGGPENWARLKPEFALCGSGERQSPIDVRDGIRVDLEPIQFDYKETFFRIVDNGHTVQVRVGEGSSIRVMGRHYDLVELNFHRPSEFRLDGVGFDMSVHLVHKDLDGRLAIVAVMLTRGSAHPLVQTLWNNLPLERHFSYAPEVSIDLRQLLPETRAYATFMGSLSTPPCTEGVLWMVMKTPLALSVEQIGIFSRLYPMNARPVQSSLGRLIKESR